MAQDFGQIAASLKIKDQAKRLQKAAPEILGAPYSLATCQEAVARAHGHPHWHDAQRVLSRLGEDSHDPRRRARKLAREHAVALLRASGIPEWADERGLGDEFL